MLEITVKTLDSQSRVFSVPDDTIVRHFKEHIARSVNIPVERQRLIYQGRVLQDDARLDANGDMDGKVIHLVERLPTPAPAPPSETTAQQATPVSTAPRGSAPGANPMGGFPMPAPGGNFMQQVINQALSGIPRPMGPAVLRGSMRQPNTSGGDSRTEIQIHITPQGATQHTRTTRPMTRPIHPTANVRPRMPQQQGPPRPVPSEPRRQMNQIKFFLTQLEQHIVALESGNLDPTQPSEEQATTSESGSSSTTEAGSSASQSENTGSSVDAQPSNGEQASTSGNEDPPRHPTLLEFGRISRRVLELETRFLPFLTEYTEFLDKDTAFSSTESPEYKKTSSFITTILKVQRALGLIHRTMSMFAIPLSDIPPRSMLIQGHCPGHAGLPQGARQVQNIASAGSYLASQPQVRHTHQMPGPFVRARFPNQVGMPVFFGPLGPQVPPGVRPGVIPMPMFRFGGPPRNVVPPQPGFHAPPPQQMAPHQPAPPSATASTPPAAAPTPPAAPSTATLRPDIPPTAASISTAPLGTTPSSGGTHVEFTPPEYAVQVTTHIQPNINININPGPLGGAAASDPGGEEIIIEEAIVEADVGMEIDETGQPIFGVSTPEPVPGGGIDSMQMNIPNIPGLPPDTMRQIIESVQNSIQEVVATVQGSTQQSGRLTVQGLEAGQDQIPMEIANIIGQTVQNVVLQHLHPGNSQQTEDPESAAASTPATASTSATEPAPTTSTATETTETSSTAAPPASATASKPATSAVSTSASRASNTNTTTASRPTTQASQQDASDIMASAILQQISGGRFGNFPGSTSNRTSSTRSRQGVEGSAGPHGKPLPYIARTPDCANDLVRGQGFPAELMQLSGHESILSFFFHLCGELLTIPDIMTLMMGATEPAERLRDPMRRALIECWFNGRTPNADDINTMAENEAERGRMEIERLFVNEQPRSADVSVVESNLSLYRYVLRKVMHMLFIQDQAEFSRVLYSRMSEFIALALRLNINILRGTEDAVIDLALNQMSATVLPIMSGTQDPALLQMRTMMRSQLVPFVRNQRVSQDQIDQFVMNVPSPAPPDQEDEMEEEVEEPQQEEKVEEAAQASASEQVEEDEVENSSEKVQNMEEETQEASGEEHDWRSMVPNEWVSVIASDIEKQKNIPEQPSYSDAYLAGMPASKRRKL